MGVKKGNLPGGILGEISGEKRQTVIEDAGAAAKNGFAFLARGELYSSARRKGRAITEVWPENRSP